MHFITQNKFTSHPHLPATKLWYEWLNLGVAVPEVILKTDLPHPINEHVSSTHKLCCWQDHFRSWTRAVRLPPHHCQQNPTELVWTRHLQDNPTETTHRRGYWNVTTDNWKNAVQHTKTTVEGCIEMLWLTNSSSLILWRGFTLSHPWWTEERGRGLPGIPLKKCTMTLPFGWCGNSQLNAICTL